MRREGLSANVWEESSQPDDTWVGPVGKTVWKPCVPSSGGLLEGQRKDHTGGKEYDTDWG